MGMKIGEVAKATGLKIETVRYYEAEGMIGPPRRSDGNYRLYDDAQLDRLMFVRRAREAGFTLEQVRDLLRLADDPRGPCAEVDALAQAHLAALDRKLAELQALRAALSQRLTCCQGPTIAECQIIDSLSRESAQRSNL